MGTKVLDGEEEDGSGGGEGSGGLAVAEEALRAITPSASCHRSFSQSVCVVCVF